MSYKGDTHSGSAEDLDIDGLKKVESELTQGTPELALFNKKKEATKYYDYKEKEPTRQKIFLDGLVRKEFSVLYKYRYRETLW